MAYLIAATVMTLSVLECFNITSTHMQQLSACWNFSSAIFLHLCWCFSVYFYCNMYTWYVQINTYFL